MDRWRNWFRHLASSPDPRIRLNQLLRERDEQHPQPTVLWGWERDRKRKSERGTREEIDRSRQHLCADLTSYDRQPLRAVSLPGSSRALLSHSFLLLPLLAPVALWRDEKSLKTFCEGMNASLIHRKLNEKEKLSIFCYVLNKIDDPKIIIFPSPFFPSLFLVKLGRIFNPFEREYLNNMCISDPKWGQEKERKEERGMGGGGTRIATQRRNLWRRRLKNLY